MLSKSDQIRIHQVKILKKMNSNFEWSFCRKQFTIKLWTLVYMSLLEEQPCFFHSCIFWNMFLRFVFISFPKSRGLGNVSKSGGVSAEMVDFGQVNRSTLLETTCFLGGFPWSIMSSSVIVCGPRHTSQTPQCLLQILDLLDLLDLLDSWMSTHFNLTNSTNIYNGGSKTPHPMWNTQNHCKPQHVCSAKQLHWWQTKSCQPAEDVTNCIMAACLECCMHEWQKNAVKLLKVIHKAFWPVLSGFQPTKIVGCSIALLQAFSKHQQKHPTQSDGNDPISKSHF